MAAISVNQAIVRQASSAISAMLVCNSTLFIVMKRKKILEGCTEQMYCVFAWRFDAHHDERGWTRLND
jgi:enoyl-[acyl-carrier protein] reductase/trans-2-enoyl-CoA reductase (NAD+)